MRVLGFSKKWGKLDEPQFTTFRFPRKDKDWEVGEKVQVVYKPRTKEREILGIAKIIDKQPRDMVKILGSPDYRQHNAPTITEDEAKVDGFKNYQEMWHWLFDTYHSGRWIRRLVEEPMNKLTLLWIEKGTA